MGCAEGKGTEFGKRIMEKVVRSKVVGVTMGNDGKKRQNAIKNYCRSGLQLKLVRETNNTYSKSAIKVCVPNGKQIGYIRDTLAEQLAPLMDQGLVVKCIVTEVTGGTKGKDSYGCNIKIYYDENRTHMNSEMPKRTGCAALLFIGLVGALFHVIKFLI